MSPDESHDELVRKLRKVSFIEAQTAYNEIVAENPYLMSFSEHEAQERNNKILKELLHRTGWTVDEFHGEYTQNAQRKTQSLLEDLLASKKT